MERQLRHAGSKKVSITMPEKLHGRLEKVRNNLNISGICQGALEREIRILELLESVATEDVIERLKLERSRHVLDSRKVGRQEGIVTAPRMSYRQLLAVEHFLGIYCCEEKKDFFEELNTDDLIESLFLDLDEEERKIPTKTGPLDVEHYFLGIKQDSGAENLDFRMYLLGFAEGVVSFFNSIKEKIGIYDPESINTV